MVLGELPPDAQFWHVSIYPNRPAAEEAAGGRRATIVEAAHRHLGPEASYVISRDRNASRRPQGKSFHELAREPLSEKMCRCNFTIQVREHGKRSR